MAELEMHLFLAQVRVQSLWRRKNEIGEECLLLATSTINRAESLRTVKIVVVVLLNVFSGRCSWLLASFQAYHLN